MNTQQPKALRLADELDGKVKTGYWEAAAELRRLHSVNDGLLEALTAIVNSAEANQAAILLPLIDDAREAIAKAHAPDCICWTPAHPAPTVQEPSEMDLQKCWVEKSDGTIDGIASMRLAIRKYSTTPPAAQPAPVQPVSGVVLRDGYPTLIQDKHIKETDQRLCIIPPAPEK